MIVTDAPVRSTSAKSALSFALASVVVTVFKYRDYFVIRTRSVGFARRAGVVVPRETARPPTSLALLRDCDASVAIPSGPEYVPPPVVMGLGAVGIRPVCSRRRGGTNGRCRDSTGDDECTNICFP